MHRNPIIGKICIYNWTGIMVDMGLYKILHHGREPRHARIFNSWIKDWVSDILRTKDQDNDQQLMHKYMNIRFLDDEDNQTNMISP